MEEETLYTTNNYLTIHVSEKEGFTGSTEYESIKSIISTFNFFDEDELEREGNMIVECFNLDSEKKKLFVTSLNKIYAITKKAGIGISCSMIGTDGNLNLEQIIQEEEGFVIRKVYSFENDRVLYE